jgi:predicted DNA-binding transcriptional regulator AlpA
MDENKNQNCRLISCRQLAKMLSLSPRTVWRLRSSQALPKPISVGSSKRWKLSDIKLYLECNCDMALYQARKESQNAS